MSVFDHLQKKGIQNCLIATSDMRLVEAALQANKGYVEDVQRETNEAWGMSPELLFRQKDTITEWLILFENEAAPGSFDNDDEKRRKNFSEKLSSIAEKAMDGALFLIQKRAAKDKMAQTYRLLAITAALFAVAAGIVLMFVGRSAAAIPA